MTLSLLAQLTGCGGDEKPATLTEIVYKTEYVFAQPDESLRTCLSQPPKPVLKDSTSVATIIADLFAWGEDCHAKHGATWKSIDDAKARALAENEKTKETPE